MAKTVLIEGHNLLLPRGTGIATYARHLVAALKESGYVIDLVFSTNRPIVRTSPEAAEIALFDAIAELPPKIVDHVVKALRELFGFPLGFRLDHVQLTGLVLDPRARALSSFDRLYPVTELPDAAKAHFKLFGKSARLRVAEQPALFHATCPMPVRVDRCPNVYTIHDLVPIRLPQTTLDDKVYTLKMLKHIGQQADHIVTVSEHSKNDIMTFLGVPEGRITNTYQSVQFPPELLAKTDGQVANELARAYGLDFKEYFIFVGAIEPKKNLGRLLDAFRATGSARPLVVVGAPAWQYESDLKKLHGDPHPSYKLVGRELRPVQPLRHLQYLPLPDVVNLIRGARALLFPSIYEGFGLPVAEAMLLNTAVMTSTVSSLPEIAGGAALLVDPTDVNDIGRGIKALDSDDDLVADLVRRGQARAQVFSPDAYHARLRTLYSKLM